MTCRSDPDPMPFGGRPSPRGPGFRVECIPVQRKPFLGMAGCCECLPARSPPLRPFPVRVVPLRTFRVRG